MFRLKQVPCFQLDSIFQYLNYTILKLKLWYSGEEESDESI